MKFEKNDKEFLLETVEDLLLKPDPLAEMEKRCYIDVIIAVGFMVGIVWAYVSFEDVTIMTLIFILILSIWLMYAYYKNLKRIQATTGKIYLSSITYLGDASYPEQDVIVNYEEIKNEQIGLKDDTLHTIKTIDENGKSAYYVSKTPLSDEWFNTQRVITKNGMAEGIGVNITTRIIDIIYDSATGERIPVRQVLMSPSMSTLDIVELEPVGENMVKFVSVTEEDKIDKNIKIRNVSAWAVTCSVCGGKLDLNAIQTMGADLFIKCVYCGTSNRVRGLKE